MAKKSRRKRRELAEKEKRLMEMGVEPKKKEPVKKPEKEEVESLEVKNNSIMDNPFVLLFLCFLFAFIVSFGFAQLFKYTHNENEIISESEFEDGESNVASLSNADSLDDLGE